MSGQVPNNLALPLHKNKIKILGTSPIMIDKAEERELFSKELDDLNIKQAPWHSVSNIVLKAKLLLTPSILVVNFFLFKG